MPGGTGATAGPGDGPRRRVTVVVAGEAVEVWPWARWRDAVVCHNPGDARRLARGEVWLADANGNPVDPDGTVVDGAAITLREPIQW